MEFLSSDYFSGKHVMPYTVTMEDSDIMPNKLWESGDWRKVVFRIKSISRYNVHCFFFQLIGAGLLTYQWASNKIKVKYILTTDAQGKYKFKSISNWMGFHFRRKGHGGATVMYSTLLLESIKV